MNMRHVPAQAIIGAGQHNEAERRLHGHWLLLARILWIAICILTLAVFCVNLLTGSNGLFTTILFVAVAGAYFAVSLVLYWRGSTDWFILLISFNLFLVGGVIIPGYPGLLIQWNWVWLFPILFLQFLAWSAFSVLYMFPDGRFIPGFTRWLALGWIAFWLVANLPIPIPDAFYPWNWWGSPLMTVVQVAYFCSLTLALLYRYRRLSTPVQRQQIKWVVFTTTVSFLEASVAYPVLINLPSYYPALGSSSLLFQLVLLITTFLAGLIPISIGIALLRYRLWEIDIIINRTLVYGTLTAMLALIYFGCVVLLQHLVNGLTGQVGQSPLIIVGSTLAIVVLSQPLRRRIQRIIDQRFYRRKYDAAKIIEAFSPMLRNQVDLNTLSQQLVVVVQETMQPTFVSLWVRPTTPARKQSAAWRSTPAAPESGKKA